MDHLSVEYGLRGVTLQDLPDDVALIRVDDSAELLALVDPDEDMLARGDAQESPDRGLSSSSMGPLYKTCSMVGLDALTYRVKLYGSLALSGPYGPYTIQGVNQWTAIEGFTLGVGWTQTYAYAYNGRTYADIFGGGTLDLYLLVQGSIRVYSRSVNMSMRCYAN